MLTRPEVYKIIDGERDYQDSLGPDRREVLTEQTHSVGEYLTMLRAYMNKADAAWTDNAGDSVALHVIRKIAAISVRCMEDNGAFPREK